MRSRTRPTFTQACLIAFVAALFGCGLTTDLEGLSGGAAGEAGIDAGTEAGMDAEPESGFEAGAESGVDASDASDDADAEDAQDADTCPVLEGADYCATIPRLTVPTQVVDGEGDEFCPKPGMRLAPDTAQFWHGSVTADSHAIARAAWSPEGLHFHIRVFQDDVVVSESDEPLWHGDGLELLAKGNANLTGAFDGVNDPGAVQLLFLPPATDGDPAARGALYLNAQFVEAYDPTQYAARLTSDGYELEVRIPWAFVGAADPASPGSGDKVAFNWALDYHSRLVKDRLWQLFAHYTDVPDGVICAGGLVEPACDDRTWCTPTLE